MDIKIPDSTLRKYLETKATPEKIAEALTLCGPSVDRLHRLADDYVYDIEAITNRVDTASAFGVAREAAAILPLLGIKAKLINSPYEIKSNALPKRKSEKLPLKVIIKDENLIPHFAAIVLDKLTVTDSPKEISDQLELSGVRPLNNLIDITNYLTLCFGQPVHIFDYDKIIGHKMILRESRAGEKLTTLDGKAHQLKGGDIVIEDGGARLIDLCGIMGGKLSEVDERTKRAVLFVQTYNPKKIRRTSLYTQERTLAAQIFEKQPDSRLVNPTLIEGVNLLIRYAGGVVAGESIDYYFQKPIPKKIKLDLKWLNRLIGFVFDYDTVSSILINLGFEIKKISPQSLEAEIPTWRLHDIEIPEDLAEEIARVYGYFRLESKLPVTANLSVTTDPLLNWEYQVKKYLSHLGFTEIFNYSLVSKNLFEKALMDPDHSIALTNPLSNEFEYLRRSLIPSLLLDLERNQGKVDQPIRIFELSNIYLIDEDKKNSLPEERPILAIATQNLDYRHAKGYLEALFRSLHLTNISFIPLKEDSGLPAQTGKLSAGPWQKNQTGKIFQDKHFIGIFGAIRPEVKASFNLNGDVYLANLDFQTISNLANTDYIYKPISDYPDMIEDITIQTDLAIGQIIQLIKQKNKLITSVIYKDSLENKHTFTVRFNNPKGNLSQEEVGAVKESLLKVMPKDSGKPNPD